MLQFCGLRLTALQVQFYCWCVGDLQFTSEVSCEGVVCRRPSHLNSPLPPGGLSVAALVEETTEIQQACTHTHEFLCSKGGSRAFYFRVLYRTSALGSIVTFVNLDSCLYSGHLSMPSFPVSGSLQRCSSFSSSHPCLRGDCDLT